MTLGINSYRDLKVWQQAMELAVECYKASGRFPKSEQYGLTSQIRRSAASIAANLAEGHGRDSTGAFVQFCRIAQGSLKELETHLILAKRLEFLDDGTAKGLLERADDIGKMTRSLIRRLQEKL